MRVLSLRLADVIGPYDDSCRFWKYVIWASLSGIEGCQIQLDIEDHIYQPLSFTYSIDVARLIIN